MARRNVADFLDLFVKPLVAGGDLTIGHPLAIADVQSFEGDLPHATEALVAVDEARANVLSQLVVRPPALILDADELKIAASIHNLLYLSHPDAETWLLRNRTRTRIVDTARRLAAQPLTQSRTRVLARHALLHNVLQVSRTDIKLSWWTGSASFLGQTPPQRLTRWRTVRRVREESAVAQYAELLNTEESAPIMAMLLRRSPLTQLLTHHPQAPALHWEDAVFILQDPALARVVTYEATRPEEPESLVAAPARYAAAFEQMLERTPRSEHVRTVTAFLVHLNALLANAEIHMHDRNAKSPLITTVLAPERASQRPRGLATFFALPNALRKVDPQLAAPPGITDEPHLATRWRVHREQVVQGVGEAVIEALVNRLSRHLGVLPQAVDISQPSH